jgi:hypothetical protein
LFDAIFQSEWVLWQTNIYDMLRRIPSAFLNKAFFDSIHSKLLEYKNLKDAPMLLELAIWKVKIAKKNLQEKCPSYR